jgi:phosphoribosylanthranilate isomerase
MTTSTPDLVRHAVRIKICGVTRADEALACFAAGADLIGLNFHPLSPRFLQPPRAAEIVAVLERPEQVVGVFVDRPPKEVAATARALGLSTVQLHGNEPPGDLVELRPLNVIRAFRIGGPTDLNAMRVYLRNTHELGRPPDAVLIDAFVPGLEGGTGVTIADELLSGLTSLPHLILAGGLTAENVSERIERVRPWMVDVASGVESSPGRKDLAKVRSFIRAVQSVPFA